MDRSCIVTDNIGSKVEKVKKIMDIVLELFEKVR